MDMETRIVLAGRGPTATELARRSAARGRRVTVLRTQREEDIVALQPAEPDAEVQVVERAERGDVVIEDGQESGDTRRGLLAMLAGAIDVATVIAVCTELDLVTDLAPAVPAPERVVGFHLSFAAPTPQLVEVIPGLATARSAVEASTAVAQEFEFDVVTAPDRPGFLVDAVLVPYLNQVLQALDDGIASGEDIDTAVRLGLGYPLGPLALLDRMGLDRHLAVAEAIHAETADPHAAPPPLLRRMVAAGWTRAASGRGFTRRGPDQEADEARDGGRSGP
jgi:3-hydroxybutyryl-CoA dehydrogenase